MYHNPGKSCLGVGLPDTCEVVGRPLLGRGRGPQRTLGGERGLTHNEAKRVPLRGREVDDVTTEYTLLLG